MHDHGTAVLDRATAAAPAATTTGTARERWLARCEASLAMALATGDAGLLPRLPQVMSCPLSDLCEDCQGTGYVQDGATFDLCYCMGDEVPAYDFPRYARGEVLAELSPRDDGPADVWVPCAHCEIGPLQSGPRTGPRALRVPWVPDCPACHDTGWTYKGTIYGSALW